jgi:hypothetical protein
MALGLVRENIDTLEAMITYLRADRAAGMDPLDSRPMAPQAEYLAAIPTGKGLRPY